MNYTPTDVKIRNGLALLKDNAVIQLNYEDKNKFLRLISELLINNLQSSKKTLVAYNSDKEREDLTRFLAKFKLSNLVLNLNPSNPLREADVYKLRSLAKRNQESNLDAAYTKFLKSFEAQEKEIKSKYSYLHTSTEEKESNFDFIQHYHLTGEAVNEIGLNINKSIPHLDRIVGLYNTNFSILEQADPFSFQFYKNISGDNQVLSHVKSLFEEALDLYNDFKKLKATFRKEYIQNAEKELLRFDESIRTIYQVLLQNEENAATAKDSFLDKFRKSKPDDYSEITGLIHEISDVIFGHKIEITTESLSTLINKWHTERNYFLDKKSNEAEAYINQLSCRSNGFEDLISMDKRLNELIFNVNETNYFKNEITNNAWNFNGQLSSLKKLITLLRNASLLVDNIMYVNWKILVNELDAKEKAIFNELYHMPRENWQSKIEDAITATRVDKLAMCNLPSKADNLDSLLSKKEELVKLSADCLQEQWSTIRQDALNQFQKNNKSLYNELFKKKSIPELTWSKLMRLENNFIASLFPILFVKTSELEKLNIKLDHVVLLGESQNIDLAKLNSVANQVLITSVSKLDLGDHEFENYSLEGFLAGHLNSVSDLQDRLSNTKLIAQQIRDLKANIKVFQCKNTVMISLLSPAKNKLILQEMDDLNLKEVVVMNDEKDMLEAAMLYDVPSKFLLIENDLINTLYVDDLEYQKEIIQNMKYFEFDVFNIWDHHLIENNNAALSEFTDMIRRQQIDITHEKQAV